MVDKKMKGAAALQAVEQAALALAAEQGLDLVEMQYGKEGGEWVLRFFIDREPPVDHDCCQAFSEAIGDWLDREDPIANSYILEVSSPGIERPLKKESDFQRFAGSRIAVSLYAPFAGKREYQGELLELKDNVLKLAVLEKTKRTELAIPYEQVAKAHLLADF